MIVLLLKLSGIKINFEINRIYSYIFFFFFVTLKSQEYTILYSAQLNNFIKSLHNSTFSQEKNNKIEGETITIIGSNFNAFGDLNLL